MNKYSFRLSFLAGLLLTLSIMSDSASMGFILGIVWGVVAVSSHANDS